MTENGWIEEIIQTTVMMSCQIIHINVQTIKAIKLTLLMHHLGDIKLPFVILRLDSNNNNNNML